MTLTMLGITVLAVVFFIGATVGVVIGMLVDRPGDTNTN